MLRSLVFLSFLLTTVVGCTTTAAGRRLEWVARHGGTAVDVTHADRAQRVAATLLVGRKDLHVRVVVLRRDDLSAYSWPDGHVYVSRGLVACGDDAVLAAAIAHEVGHLIDRADPRALTGPPAARRRLDVEARADRIGTDLLRAGNVPAQAMPRMLRQVMAQQSLPPETRAALWRRVRLLETAPAGAGGSDRGVAGATGNIRQVLPAG